MGGEWRRTIGGGRILSEGWCWTESGGEREAVGSVERVRLSKKGGGWTDERKEGGSLAGFGRVGNGVFMASSSCSLILLI